jgi:hypothetical protein
MMTSSHCHSKRAIRLRIALSGGLRAFGLVLPVNVSGAALPETMQPPPHPMLGIDHISPAVRNLSGAAFFAYYSRPASAQPRTIGFGRSSAGDAS